jgi:lysophospholipase L1-like esterase
VYHTLIFEAENETPDDSEILMRFTVCLGILTILGASAAGAQQPLSDFQLKQSDRVAFYGDSITEQREYSADVEEYVVTRFPGLDIKFFTAAMGGDTVRGGIAGPIEQRLQRDLFAVSPSVVTVMLGFNDGYAVQEQPGIAASYEEGFNHLLDEITSRLPQARVTLIAPSPFDDVTRPPLFPGGYNEVMLSYGRFVAEQSRIRHLGFADFNTPVTDVLKKFNTANPALAVMLLPDRVHPQEGAHWVMAESLLKSWHAPALVDAVALDAAGHTTSAQNTEITAVHRDKKGLTWEELDHALPLPLSPAEVDPVLDFVARQTDLVQSLDQQPLSVTGLATGQYDLFIDNRKIATFSATELASGVNLALLDTPMLEQARLVAQDCDKRSVLEESRFDLVRAALTSAPNPTIKALSDAIGPAVERERRDAQPRLRVFRIAPVGSANLPPILKK